MSTDDYAALAALAAEATPGPWIAHPGGYAQPAVVYVERDENPRIAVCEYLDSPNRSADAAYIAAASPDVVRALIAEIRRLRGESNG